jgi:hypothetical protein
MEAARGLCGRSERLAPVWGVDELAQSGARLRPSPVVVLLCRLPSSVPVPSPLPTCVSLWMQTLRSGASRCRPGDGRRRWRSRKGLRYGQMRHVNSGLLLHGPLLSLL